MHRGTFSAASKFAHPNYYKLLYLNCLYCTLSEEFVDFLHGFREGEDCNSVVGLDLGVTDCDKAFITSDNTSDDGIAREAHILERHLGDLGIRSNDELKNLSVGSAHVFNEAHLVAECEFEDSSCSDELLVDDSVHAHTLSKSDILDILNLGDCAGNSETLGCNTSENVRFRTVGYCHECIKVLD